MSDKIQPLHDRIILEPIAVESKTASGIIIPDTAKEKPQKGKVAYVGTYSKINDLLSELIGYLEGECSEDGLLKVKQYRDELEKMVINKGDIVLYGKHAGQEIDIEGTKHLLMREADCVAIIL